MNQISKAARPDLRITESAWRAPAATVEYDKDGNPATVVSTFRPEFHARPVRPSGTAGSRPAIEIARCDTIEYDDGNPGTVLA